MDLGLRDKTVLITGASGGIGRALATVFAGEGASLVLTGHSRIAELDEWLGGQAWGERALTVEVDVTDPAAVRAAFARGLERFGRVDACVANAGVWPKEDLPLDQAPEERIRRSVEVNLLGSVWTARAFAGALRQVGPRPDGHGASLCFIGSTAGRFGERGHAEYSLAKAGLQGLAQTLKNELVEIDPYARVNLVEPGWTVTHMVREELETPGVITRVVRTMPLRQLARAVDVARTVAFLSSPAAARHLSGQTLTVAGGMEGRVLWPEGALDEEAVRARRRQD
jgi:3-oxoacyl-[acyl-carrier protein] reductase